MADAADNQFGTGAESGGEGASGEEGASCGAKRRMVASLGRSDKNSWGAEEADVRRKQVTGAASGDEGVSQLVPPVKHKKMVTLRTVSLLYRHQC